MSTHNLCFEQKYDKKYQSFLSENFQFWEVKFSIYMYLNRHVLVMLRNCLIIGIYKKDLLLHLVIRKACLCKFDPLNPTFIL